MNNQPIFDIGFIPQSGKQMSYGRNGEQTEDYLPSSTFQFSSEALHSFSYANNNQLR